MSEDLIRYDVLIENALRDVVYQAMSKVARDGLLADHHFYITFQTGHPDVEIPDYLRKQYPDEMTIVLQHQFYGLKVDKDGFSVMLSFNNIRERLSIPFKAITTFADPSVNFALQFQVRQEGESAQAQEDTASEKSGDGAKASLATEKAQEPSDKPDKGDKRGEVISLDKFRKR